MRKLPGDEFVTIELVHNPSVTAVDGGTRLSHFVIHVGSSGPTVHIHGSGFGSPL